MKNTESSSKQKQEVVTIGQVKAPISVWQQVATYQTRERAQGRKLKRPEALLELAAIGAKHEGI